jgi:hypothetical protein
MDIIDVQDLADYLRDSSLASDAALIQIVDLVNDLVNDNWSTPADPAPARIRLLALNVGARAWAWNPASANLESITRSIDDGSRTERYRSGSSLGSVYLTDDELLLLRGKPSVQSVRLVNYGDL